MLKRLPQPLRDQVGGVLFWIVGVPLLIVVGGGAFLIAGQIGGILGVVGLGVAIIATFAAIGACLKLAGKVFMAIGRRLEPRIGESAASAIAFLFLAGAVAAVFWLGTERPWEQRQPAVIDPKKPMTQAECRTYTVIHPEYECVPVGP